MRLTSSMNLFLSRNSLITSSLRRSSFTISRILTSSFLRTSSLSWPHEWCRPWEWRAYTHQMSWPSLPTKAARRGSKTRLHSTSQEPIKLPLRCSMAWLIIKSSSQY
jgi:hypothetical protein